MRASQTINTITSTARSERPSSDIALGPREPHRVNLTDHDHCNYLVSRYCCFSIDRARSVVASQERETGECERDVGSKQTPPSTHRQGYSTALETSSQASLQRHTG